MPVPVVVFSTPCLFANRADTDRVYAVAVTPDGGRAVSGSRDKTLRLGTWREGMR